MPSSIGRAPGRAEGRPAGRRLFSEDARRQASFFGKVAERVGAATVRERERRPPLPHGRGSESQFGEPLSVTRCRPARRLRGRSS